MSTPKQRLPVSTAGGGGGGRRAASGSGVLPPLVVLVFLFVVAPSLFFVARNGGHVHVASDPKGRNGDQVAEAMKSPKSILSKEVIDAVAASQQEAGALSLDFF